jgi:hypothetical protein
MDSKGKIQSKATTVTHPELEKQRAWSKKKRTTFDFSLVVADAFVRGIRDIGYKHTGTAIDELIDNAIQAGTSSVDIAFGFEGGSDKKPDRLAVIDPGHGMDPEMIPLAVVWGGTHREDDRKGFGRYGYGLPSAAVSQGRRFTVYSRPSGGKWTKVSIDVDEISEGKYTNEQGRIVVSEAAPAVLPFWIDSYVEEHFGD